MKTVTIVGGGISGLVTALFLKDHFKVNIIEKNSDVGGLLRSIRKGDAASFDYGTHIVKETGIGEIDKLLFHPLKEKKQTWNTFPTVKAGNFFNGKLYKYSPFVNLGHLSKSDCENAKREILACSRKEKKKLGSLDEKSRFHFGNTVTDKITQILIAKQFSSDLKELRPCNPFFLSRVIDPSGEMTEKKSSDPFVDARFAFPSYDQGVGSLLNYYPCSGGIGKFIEHIKSLLGHPNIKFYLGANLTKVEYKGNQVKALEVNNNERINTGVLIWSLPTFILLKMLELKDFNSIFKAKSLSIHHFSFETPLLLDNHYITNYDLNFLTFRVTLYPNIGAIRPERVFNLTVEVIEDGKMEMATKESLLNELVEMGVIGRNSKPAIYFKSNFKMGFPILSHSFYQEIDRQVTTVEEKFKNVVLIGKSKCKTFFMDSVLKEAYQTAKQLTSEV